ncbi:MAG TPA: sulfatase-like hydrolase/transferase, partial [Bryobacteraceae bacterium]
SDAANTLICFFSDHGDHLGDHHAWQKESFFEASAHVPFLVSWPEHIEAGATRDRLVSLTDLFGLATSAAGSPEWREGSDLFGTPREYLLSFYGAPGTRLYKVMVRHGSWKYIYMANGGREQLFNLQDDPHELRNVAKVKRDIASHLHAQVAKSTSRPSLRAAMDGDDLRAFPFAARPLQRIYQFDRSRGVRGFPQHPKDALAQWRS